MRLSLMIITDCRLSEKRRIFADGCTRRSYIFGHDQLHGQWGTGKQRGHTLPSNPYPHDPSPPLHPFLFPSLPSLRTRPLKSSYRVSGRAVSWPQAGSPGQRHRRQQRGALPLATLQWMLMPGTPCIPASVMSASSTLTILSR